MKSKDEAYESIQKLIISMEIKPGESITETALSERLGIGRTPIREALARLESEGLIYSKKGRKTVYRLTVDEIIEIFDIKYALEGAIVGWAAKRGSKSDKKKLKEIVQEMKAMAQERPEDEDSRQRYLEDWLELDKRLHQLIFKMANSRKAADFIEKLNIQWHRMRVSIYILEGRTSKSALEHEEFVTHIINGNAEEAEASIKRHIEYLKKEIINFMNLFSYSD